MVTVVVIYLGSLECLLAVAVCCLFGVRFVCSCVEILCGLFSVVNVNSVGMVFLFVNNYLLVVFGLFVIDYEWIG